MKIYNQNLINTDIEFLEIIQDIINNPVVQEMKKYKQHYNTSCYEHCYMVSYYCYLISKKCNLDYISATRGAMLHDFFLYDWRKKIPNEKGLHAFAHPKIACDNACELFNLNEKEKEMILTHMWPLTIKLPSSFEGLILTFVDKYCAFSESFDVLKTALFTKKFFRYIYTFSSFITVKIC